jgi:site-specific DNA recombinase
MVTFTGDADTQRVAIYCRISRDASAMSLGVKRQERLCRELVAARGWTVAAVFVDNDTSATGNKPRPEYQRLLRELDGRAFGVVVALDSDRLLRKPGELEQLFVICEARGVRVQYQSGGWDPISGDGMMEARIRAAVDAEEVRKLKTRVGRKVTELALAGKVGGGGTRPFGYEADRVTVCEPEAVLIREALEAVLAGDSLRSIARGWTSRGVASSAGGRWSNVAIRRMLISPRIAGLRQHRGKVVADAVWPAIVPRDRWERCKAILTDPARVTNGAALGRRYLLTGGLGVCGLCGSPLSARPRSGSRRSYVCSRDHGGCGRMRIMADDFEAFVGEAVQAALESPEIDAALAAADASHDDEAQIHDALRADEALLRDYEREAAERGLEPSSFFSFRGIVEARMAENRRRLASCTGTSAVAAIPTGEVREAWAAGSLDWRRTLLSAIVLRVVVGPALVGRNFFDENRISIDWRV